MIYFNINIRNPKWWERFDSLWVKTGSTFLKHKYWEIQAIKGPDLFRVEFEWTIQQDHAGLRIELGLFGYCIHFTIYDDRHWNIDLFDWEDHSYDDKKLDKDLNKPI